MNRVIAAAALLLFAGVALAEVSIEGPASIKRDRIARLKAQGAADGAALIWDFDEDRLDAEEVGGRLFLSGPPGTYKVKLRVIALSKEGKASVETARFTLVIDGEGPTPGPTPPVPPPVPPDPPAPDVPIKEPGLRVLIVYESADLAKMPAPQQAILYSKTVRDFLNAKCVLGPDNKTREWGIYDKDADMSAQSAIWQGAMKRPRSSLPWALISDGKKGFEGPLPANVADTMALLSKFAPAARKGK